MQDCFGRDIKAGDIVAYASSNNCALLSVGEVVGPCKKNPAMIRVKVFRSSRYVFTHGRKNWRTGEYTREPGQPYMVNLSMGNRIVIINNDVASFRP